jgi:hypothetical protein
MHSLKKIDWHFGINKPIALRGIRNGIKRLSGTLHMQSGLLAEN